MYLLIYLHVSTCVHVSIDLHPIFLSIYMYLSIYIHVAIFIFLPKNDIVYLSCLIAVNPELCHAPLVRLVPGSSPLLVLDTADLVVHIKGAHCTTVHVEPPYEAGARGTSGCNITGDESGHISR